MRSRRFDVPLQLPSPTASPHAATLPPSLPQPAAAMADAQPPDMQQLMLAGGGGGLDLMSQAAMAQVAENIRLQMEVRR